MYMCIYIHTYSRRMEPMRKVERGDIPAGGAERGSTVANKSIDETEIRSVCASGSGDLFASTPSSISGGGPERTAANRPEVSTVAKSSLACSEKGGHTTGKLTT